MQGDTVVGYTGRVYLVLGTDIGVVFEKLLHYWCSSCPAAEMQRRPPIVICAVDGNILKKLRDLLYISR